MPRPSAAANASLAANVVKIRSATAPDGVLAQAAALLTAPLSRPLRDFQTGSNRPISSSAMLFSLFLHEIISAGPPVRRRIPRLPASSRPQEQRERAVFVDKTQRSSG